MNIIAKIQAAAAAIKADREAEKAARHVASMRHIQEVAVPSIVFACDELRALVDELATGLAEWSPVEAAELLAATVDVLPAYERLRASLATHLTIAEAQRGLALDPAKIAADTKKVLH